MTWIRAYRRVRCRMAAAVVAAGILLVAGESGAVLYYVNDASTAGDVYCTAVGNDANSGLASNLPKLTLTNLIASYTITTGDVVYIDTGLYQSQAVVFATSGHATNLIVIQGSTNYAAGGTVVDRRTNTADAIVLSGNNIRISDITLRGGRFGLHLIANSGCEMVRITSVSNTTGFRGSSAATSHRFSRCTAAFNGTGLADFSTIGGITWDQGVMWSNTTAFSPTSTNVLSVSNSVIVGGTAYATLPLRAEFNVYWNTTLGGTLRDLTDLHALLGHSFQSTFADPRFANPAGLDFHPQSVVGRYVVSSGTFTSDAVHSRLIDLGDPARAFGNETGASNARMNLGLFGNHPEASRSRTNTWLYAVSLNDGGTVAGTSTLYWACGAVTNGTTVRLDYSPDNGTTWSNIITAIPATNHVYTWVATGAVPSIVARWRVLQEGGAAAADTNDAFFVLRPRLTNAFSLYVNDASPTGDVYSTGVGHVTNSGLVAAQPMLDLQALLDTYAVGPGDVVYVDTGVYTNSITITFQDQGTPGSPMTIRGSPNLDAGGTLFNRNLSTTDVITVLGATYVRLANVITRGGRFGVVLNGSAQCEITDVLSISNNTGFRCATTAPSNTFRRCIAISNGTGVDIANIANVWDGGVCWSNTTAFSLSSSNALTVQNSVFVGGTVYPAGTTPTTNDFNVYWTATLGGGFNNLYEFQRSRNTGWQSTFANPQFAAPLNLDFHARSLTGRYVVATASFTNDTVHSPLIDFGDPTRPVGDEPPPNGGRLNAGPFGGTSQASKSITNAWLLALSLQDGGQLTIGDSVYWTGGNLPSGATVRIEFSGDAGQSWNFVATNILASLGAYVWSNTNYPSSTSAQWRVVYEANTNVIDASGQKPGTSSFTLRNGAFRYYVNDDSLAGDIYCTAIGSDTNLGSTPATPKASLTNLLAAADLEPGDVVYVDTGIYRSQSVPVVGSADSGAATNYVVIIGSTNRFAGGTVFDRQSPNLTSYGLHLNNASFVEVRYINVTNAGTGFRVEGSTGIRLLGSSVRNTRTTGFHVRNSGGTVLDQCFSALNGTNGFLIDGSTGVVVRRSVAWRNALYGMHIDSGSASVSGSILVASTPFSMAYRVPAATNLTAANYNCIHLESNAFAAVISSTNGPVDTLAAWVALTGHDAFSLSVDPEFADPGNGDFHLRTQTTQGRFDPAQNIWVSDPITSPLIDSGDPAGSFSNEPPQNGSRVNLDLFADTWEASKGRTTPWLQAASLRDGGWVRGTVTLHWVAGNFASGTTVRVDVSTNGGRNWLTVSNAVAAGTEQVAWDSTGAGSTPAGLWRVVSTADENLLDATTNFFAVRNSALAIYINDADTSGDIYSSGIGAFTNWEASPGRPLHSLPAAFRLYDLEPGDVVYVDTGTYQNDASAVDVRRADSGNADAPVRVLGSTNVAAGGTVVDRLSGAAGSVSLALTSARWLAFSNLTLRGAANGVVVTNSSDVVFSIGSVGHSTNGFLIAASTNIQLTRAVAAHNGARGLASFQNVNLAVTFSALWSNGVGAVFLQGGGVAVSNSLVTATGAGRYVYEIASTNDVLASDYNAVLAFDGAQKALSAARALKFLSDVQRTLRLDYRSLTHNPLLADPAAGDFHPMSEVGRYQPGVGLVFDGANSPLIDTGDPLAAFAAEPPPNGLRVNVGLFGNHPEASLSRTNPWLLVLTLNDGGSVRGTNRLDWVAGGSATGHQVRIEFSRDNGLTWTNIATNVAASTGTITNWDVSAQEPSLAGRWRVTSLTDTNVYATNEVAFKVDTGPQTYYVNDASTDGDIYALVPGNANNDGNSPGSPKLSLQAIITEKTLSPGDRIVIDTGVYTLNSAVHIDANTFGVGTNYIVIQGSTNFAAGGTVIDAQSQAISAIELDRAGGLRFRDLRIRNARTGFLLEGVTNGLFEGITVEMSHGFSRDVFGFDITEGTGLTFRACAVAGLTNRISSAGLRALRAKEIRWLHGVMWSNALSVSLTESGFTASNSIFGASGPLASVYNIGLQSSVLADFNNYHLGEGAMLGGADVFIVPNQAQARVLYDSVALWTRETGNDRFSLSRHPEFADAAAFDFHLKSQGGRPTASGSIVTDEVTSAMMDAGDPAGAFGNEPAPNGGRLDLGIYGNTGQASFSPTNAGYTVVTLNDGTRASGTNVVLHWITRGNATGHAVRVEVSPFGLDSHIWIPVATNLPAGTRTQVWNTTTWTSTPTYHWRVQSQVNTGVLDRSDQAFAVRNTNFVFYVNDTSTVGDVYCQSIGIVTNTGLLPDSALPSLQQVLDTYDLEPGDTVYIDTGAYAHTGTVNVLQMDTGYGTNAVVFQGSTNTMAGGSVFTGRGIFSSDPRNLALRDISVNLTTGPREPGLRLVQASNTVVESVHVRGGGQGFDIGQSALTTLRGCTAVGVLTNGLFDQGSFATKWENGVLWSNRVNVLAGGFGLTVSNSIIVTVSNQTAFRVTGVLTSDYNCIFVSGGGIHALEFVTGRALPLQYDSVGRWARNTGRDQHSLSENPLLANPPLDFHPLSQAGRYVVSNGTFVLDDVTSPLVDAGHALGAYSNEMDPNGLRLNIGLHGNTAEASKTPPDPTLIIVSLNDGGVASGTNQVLYWVARGDATGMSVRIEFSGDAGLSWTTLASNVPPGSSSFEWNTTSFPSTVLAQWKVVAEDNTNVVDVNDQLFAVRNGPIRFFVNDASTNGDVYCLATGLSANQGITNTLPKASLNQILTAYDLEPGDVVYVDTGSYTSSAAVSIGQLDAGDSVSNVYVVIQGSTNEAAGGTVLIRNGSGPVIDVFDAAAVRLRYLRLTGGTAGVQVQDSPKMSFVWVETVGGQLGFSVSSSDDAQFSHCVARNASQYGLSAAASSGLRWESGVFWSNALYGVRVTSKSTLAVSNSVLAALRSGSYAYFYSADSTLLSDYNCIYLTNGAYVAEQATLMPAPFPILHGTVSRWARDTGRDRFSLSHAPLFADPDNGDFHLLSEGGRYVPATGTFTNDAVTSPLIDAGSPFGAFANETAPNGARVNIGRHGNTPFASRAPTNAAYVAVAFNDGGRAEGGAVPLYWVARGDATAGTVRLEFSVGTSEVWSVIASNVPAVATSPLFWNATAVTSTPLGVWRVVNEANPTVWDANDANFAMRNAALRFYVNDGATNGDVYASAAGNPLHDGAEAHRPAAHVQAVLDRYDLEPGDVIYVDTGNYTLPGNGGITWGYFDAWESMTNVAPLQAGGSSVILQGSTNVAAGGTTFIPFQLGTALLFDRAFGVSVRDIKVRQTDKGSGTAFDSTVSYYMRFIRARAEDGAIGFHVNDSDGVTFNHCVASGNKDRGLSTFRADSTLWVSGVLWSNRYNVLQNDDFSGLMTVENSIISALATGSFAYLRVRGILQTDFNAIYRTNGGFAAGVLAGGTLGGGTTRYENVQAWVSATAGDLNTIGINPRVADATDGDFHLQSPYGRYVTGVGYITNTSEALSRLIDAGRPGTTNYTLETAPNGDRLNMGLYGNTRESSLSPTNGLVTTVTFNDGGSGAGVMTLRWTISGPSALCNVALDFSRDGGFTWTNIVTGIPASAGQYVWDSEPYGRAAAGLWRITSLCDASVTDTNDAYFSLRNPPNPGAVASIPYYVNDASLVGDVYCVAPGSDFNDGFLPTTPKATLQSLIDAVDLEEGDIVYIDTGSYLLVNEVLIGDLDAGTATNHVIIQGSTNYAAGGTVLNRQTGFGNGIHLFQTLGIQIRDLKVINASVGVNVNQADATHCVRVRAENCIGSGFLVSLTTDSLFENCVAAFSSNGLNSVGSHPTWRNGVIWGNQNPVLLGAQGHVVVFNSVLHAAGSSARIFSVSEVGGTVTSDYNNIVRESGALLYERTVAVGGHEIYPALVDWQGGVGQDRHSLAEQPMFVDANAGDFHVQSAQGRFLDNGSLTNDPPGTFSPLLDTGDPSSIYTNELPPNGKRVNIGAYGGTPQASLSQTNPWLLAASFNDGGIVRGTVTVYWVSGGMSSTATVRLEYAVDGVQFTPFATNLPASQSTSLWDVSQLPVSVLAKWRVASETYTGIVDEAGPFVLKPEVLNLYVNDGSTDGDIYCTVIGSCTNDGRAPDRPLCDPALALQTYPLGAGDTVYIDTGNYALSSAEGMVAGLVDVFQEVGITGLPIRILGSTNEAFGGTLIIGTGGTNSAGVVIQSSAFVEIANLKVTGAGNGVALVNSVDVSLTNVVSYGNALAGFRFSQTAPIRMHRCESRGNATFGTLMSTKSAVQWERGVVWSNQGGGFSMVESTLTISNSIVQGANTNRYLFSVGVNSSVQGDYNFFWMTNGAILGRDVDQEVEERTLKKWQADQNSDAHSVVYDPLVENPGAGDFHLRSKAGRYSPISEAFVTTDTETSWAIDAGDPASAFGLEPAPHGQRMNVGTFGNTPQASKSLTSAVDRALLAVSLNDGGLVNGPQMIYWLTRAVSTSDLVYINFTPNKGQTWIPIATNVPALQHEVLWNPEATNSTPVGHYEIGFTDGAQPSVTNVRPFRVGLVPIALYVNDAFTNGDVYTTAVGIETNDGLSPQTPKLRVQGVFDDYDLEPGDTIYVDTGFYALDDDIRILNDDSGSATSKVYMIGSTNVAAGGTMLDRQSANKGSLVIVDAVINAFSARHLNFSHLTLQNGNVGLLLNRTSDSTISNALIRRGGRAGIQITDLSSGNRMRRVAITEQLGPGIAADGGNNNLVEHSVIWSNFGSAVAVTFGSIIVSNSVLHASDTNNCIQLSDTASIVSDYNNLHVVGDARPGRVGNLVLEGVPQWVAHMTQDVHSLSADPLFADPTNYDFHVRSPVGRFDPMTQAYVTTDTNHSYMIDTGGRTSPYTNEPAPNGDRVNIGLYGDSRQASLSSTNPWVLAITCSSGGRLAGTFYLVWASGGLSPTNGVDLDFSYDGGTNWVGIATNVPAVDGEYLWNSLLEPFAVTPLARWRLSVTGNTNIMDATDLTCGINRPFRFYVNDASTNGDVYCTAPCSPLNLGIFSNAPKCSLQDIFLTWDLEGGDYVYVDTGLYLITSNDLVTIGRSDEGDDVAPVTIIGSTNGSIMQWVDSPFSPFILDIEASRMTVAQLEFVSGSLRIIGTNVLGMDLVFTNGNLQLGGVGTAMQSVRMSGGALFASGQNQDIAEVTVQNGRIELSGGQVTLRNSVAFGTQSVLAVVSGTNIVMRNNTLVSTRKAVHQVGVDSSLVLRNNILIATASDSVESFVLERASGVLDSDYNNLVARNGAWIGNANGNWERLLYWQRASLQDANSIAVDPLFADEGGGDFHLRSIVGRYTPSGFVMDGTHSPCIDMGSPAFSIGDETFPHGGRINMGAYGGTPQASRSRTGPWLFAMTMNDGGVLKGTNVIRWAGGNIFGGTVTLQYSPDNGASWTTFASGVSALANQYTWDSTQVPSSLFAQWRVVLDADTNVSDQTDAPFAVRNSPLGFYVNDGFTAGDTYSSAAGASINDGLSAAAPKNSIQSMLNTYDLEGGDVVYVDTGVYNVTQNVTVIWSRGGDPIGGPLLILGSTNVTAGGARIQRSSASVGNDGFDLKASHVTLRNLDIRGAYRGVFVDSNTQVNVERVMAVSNEFGVAIMNAQNIAVRNSIFWNNRQGGVDVSASQTTAVENSTFYGNAPFGYRSEASTKRTVQNNIFGITTTNATALAGVVTGTVADIFVDYNVYYFVDPTGAFHGSNRNLLAWQLASGHDFRSAVTNPLLANAEAGDFHLKSTLGRFVDGSGWTTDAEDSWAIDKGGTNSPYANEPEPNGRRINIGAYGNTEFASLGRTSSAVLVETRVLNVPTHIDETNSLWPLIWSVVNVPTTELFRVEYSGDNGLTWYVLSNNVPAYQEYILWQTTPFFNTYRGRWRIVGLNDTNYWDINDSQFDLFYGKFQITSENFQGLTNRFVWRGAWAEYYQVQYSTNIVSTNAMRWRNAVNGAQPNQIANFLSTNGGDFIYADPESVTNKHRVYRVLWQQF